MDFQKYNRVIDLLCPTCGCTQYEVEGGVDETIEMVTCASCGRELSKDELRHENSENIDEHVKEVKAKIAKDLFKDLKKFFK